MVVAQGEAAKLRQALAPGDSLQKVNQQIPNLVAIHIAPSPVGGFVPGVGRDFGFQGAAMKLKIGEISEPIEGNNGYFILKLIARTEMDANAYVAQRDQLRSQIMNERKSRFLSEWRESLKKSAEIVDNRDTFYR